MRAGRIIRQRVPPGWLGGGGGGSSKTTPFLLPGLVALWSSDVGVTTVSGAVSAWADQSGNSHTLTQATAGQRPTFNATDANYGGLPSFTFVAASTKCLNSDPSFSLNQPCTIYQVCNITTNADASFDCQPGGTFIRIRNFVGHWDISAGTDLLGPTGTTTVAAVAGVFNGASSVLYVNASGSGTSGAAGAQNLTGGVAVGGSGSLVPSMDGTMAFTAIYSQVHSQAQVAAMFGYFNKKYGIAAS